MLSVKNVLIFFLITALARVTYGSEQATYSLDHGGVEFVNWNSQYGGWEKIQYRRDKQEFEIYDFPNINQHGGISRILNGGALSPAHDFLTISRTEYGVLSGQNGEAINYEKSYCDVLSLQTGCIVYTGDNIECLGTWNGERWQTEDGDIPDLVNSKKNPKKLREDALLISDETSRAQFILPELIAGVDSFMSCNTAGKYVAEYNDLGYFLARGGYHLAAMEFYENLIKISPNRTPLKLNMADSLWALGRKPEARDYYLSYSAEMNDKGAAAKVPARVYERTK